MGVHLTTQIQLNYGKSAVFNESYHDFLEALSFSTQLRQDVFTHLRDYSHSHNPAIVKISYTPTTPAEKLDYDNLNLFNVHVNGLIVCPQEKTYIDLDKFLRLWRKLANKHPKQGLLSPMFLLMSHNLRETTKAANLFNNPHDPYPFISSWDNKEIYYTLIEPQGMRDISGYLMFDRKGKRLETPLGIKLKSWLSNLIKTA